ncbi:MAG: AAA family ATPase, partial [Actinomycetota bacterium]|nr:AAA family ATPase [Actinomycetota bacterium]
MSFLLPGRAPYVGRRAELEILASELSLARRGHLRVVTLEGEAGIGKSRLADHFLSRTRGIIALTARGYPFGTDTPFALWAEALEGHLRTLPNQKVRSLCGGFLDDLSPVLRSAATARDESAGTAQPRVREGLVVLVGNLAATAPVVLVLDDLQLADAASWDALDYVARNLSGARFLVIGCVRPVDLAGRSAAKLTLLRLEQDSILRRIELAPLGVDDLWVLSGRVLGRPSVPQALASWLSQRSGGNPLFALGLLDALVAEGADLTHPQLQSLPESLTERIAAAVAGLDDDHTALLEHLAVLGRRISLSEMTEGIGGDEAEIARVADSLVGIRLVAEHQRGPIVEYEIAHPLIRDAIYERTTTARRRLLHRKIAAILMEAGRIVEAAAHFALAAHPGDAEAMRVLVTAAGTAWREGAFSEAFQIARPLLELIPTGDERWIELLDALPLDDRWLFHHRTEIDYGLGAKLMTAIEGALQDSDDPIRQGTVNFNLATFKAWGTGDRAEARRRAEVAMGLFGKAGDHRRAGMAANELAWVVGLSGDFAAQEKTASRALEEAYAARDRGVTGMALHAMASTMWPRGRFAEAEDAWRRNIEIARAEGNTARLAEAHAILALSLSFEGRLEEGAHSLKEGATADRHGIDLLILEIDAYLAWFRGDLSATVARAREASAIRGSLQTNVLQLGAMAAAETGDVAEARRLLSGAQAAVNTRGYWIIEPLFLWARGVVGLKEQASRRALDDVDAAAARLRAIDAVAVEADVLVDLAEAEAELNRPDAVMRAANRISEIWHAIGTDRYRALAALGSACAALVSRVDSTTTDAVRDAADVFSDGG